MSRKLVWALAFSAAALTTGTVAAQQFRGYGDSYDAAPGYYGGQGYGGGGYGGQGYGGQAYGGQGSGGQAYGGRAPDQANDPYETQPRRFRGPYQGYNNDPDPGEPGYRAPSGARQPTPRRDWDYGDRGRGYPGDGRDYGYGYDQGPMPAYAEPYGGGREPGQKASDYDLGENAKRTTMTEVENTTHQPPGTIVINTAERHLYYVQSNGQALQYGIGVGREGFTWKGAAHVQRKSEWPDWIPPSDMLKRRPDLPSRMAGGIENPLGARALYLFKGSKDTMFRIHGTNEPDTIGKAVSSGCIRMMNADVIDLYRRVPIGTKVVVL